MKNTGIWLDKNEAIVIFLEGGKEEIFSIPSNLEHFHIQGGSGTRFKGGPQDVVQDSKYMQRETHQLNIFFKNIIENVKDSNAIVLFGPAQVKEKFNKELEKHYPSCFNILKGVYTTDSMTDNQLKAWVRKFYS
ncbi:hypothetical protein [Urechidicola vernalis]|uniref:Host attachment protein n=1 Tax=Urechidicola vernalis TaxID=3075600 RepID=A0ABU2Y4D9_9FLAO|nr:hypothetical protein [Urechidicola sp. P050]MDT0552130.1 hypothetical protein [Urechidicola sp. P050]